MRKAMVYLGRDKEARQPEVEELVDDVLVDDYPEQVLVSATEDELARLRQMGFEVAEMPAEQQVQINEYAFGQEELSQADDKTWATLLQSRRIHLDLDLLNLELEMPRGPRLYLVLLVGPTLKRMKDEIEAQGALIREAAGPSALVALMDEDVRRRVSQLSCVEAVRPYYAGLKISPALTRADEHHVRGKPSEDDTIDLYAAIAERLPQAQDVEIELYEAQDREHIEAELQQLGGEVIDAMGTTIISTLPDLTAIHRLAEDTAVRAIHPYATDEYFNNVAAEIMKVQAVRTAAGLDGTGQVVAVCDSGLDIGQNGSGLLADFRGRIVDIYAWGRPNDASDLNGHGTHVAGSIVGTGANAQGAVTGLAPAARLIFQSIAGERDELKLPTQLTSLFHQAFGEGATIHNNSWGKASSALWGSYNSQSRSVDQFIWEHRTFLILFAAGNEGRNQGCVTPPGTAKNCLTVGAAESQRALPSRVRFPPSDLHPSGTVLQIFDQADNPDQVADFSNRGPTADGRLKPDVVAPGSWILSTRSSVCVADHGPDGLPTTDFGEGVHMTHDKAVGLGLPGQPVYGTGDHHTPPLPNGVGPDAAGHYMYLSGTSMATPLVAGAAALCRQYLVQHLKHANPSAALLKAILVNGAIGVGPEAPDVDQGWGRVDLEQALFPPPGVPITFSDDPALAVPSGEARTFTVRPANPNYPMRITLVYSDAPERQLVNRLCLVIRGPRGGLLTYPRAGGATFPPLPAQVRDNVQRVVLSRPADGEYHVIVYGCEVQVGIPEFPDEARQDFALAVANCAGPLTLE